MLAGLCSLVATYESRGVDPFDYLVEVLTRVPGHPADAIDELLPGAWAGAGYAPYLQTNSRRRAVRGSAPRAAAYVPPMECSAVCLA
jgi:hypothetical protein